MVRVPYCAEHFQSSCVVQILLAILGFPAALLLPIPKAIGVDYRSILRAWNGEKS